MLKTLNMAQCVQGMDTHVQCRCVCTRTQYMADNMNDNNTPLIETQLQDEGCLLIITYSINDVFILITQRYVACSYTNFQYEKINVQKWSKIYYQCLINASTETMYIV